MSSRLAVPLGTGLAVLVGLAVRLPASSHMDAPSINLDDAANTTDVYAFVTAKDGVPYLTTALSVYPFQEPGIGPNAYRFDDDVLYELHVALGDDVAAGEPTLTYQFRFETSFRNERTLLQSFLPTGSGGVVPVVDPDGKGFFGQNMVQTYSVTRIDRRDGPSKTDLGTGFVPPNNQGNATRFYNVGDDGEQPAKDGVGPGQSLDPFTVLSIAGLAEGYTAFAGQREDGFYADIQAIFDLLALREGDDVFDSQGGFNVHTIVLDIPVSDLGGSMQQAGVFATTSRRKGEPIGLPGTSPGAAARFEQVARQGNPLFCEAFVAIGEKDLYNRTLPGTDAGTFIEYALEPELSKLINFVLFDGQEVAGESNRIDIAGIYVPDVIKVDLSTGPVPLAGGGPDHPTNPDDAGFSRLSVFGDDTVFSPLVGDVVPSGWPNGRRFGDDVVDIGVSALLSDLVTGDIVVADGIDNVSANDAVYSRVFPYAGTPHNGRQHDHHGE